MGACDGGCKHIAAAMYSFDDLVNNSDKESITSGTFLSVKRPKSETKPVEIKDLLIKKWKAPSHDKRKRQHPYVQHIDFM